jgi:O-antigen/teichoic acid export membrane protein
VIQICTLVIYQQTDRVIVGVFVGAAAVALYEAAGKFQALVVQLTGICSAAVLPLASNLDSEGRHDTLQALMLRGTKYTLAFITPIVLTLIVIARPLLTRWLGPAYTSQALAVQVILLHQLFTPGTAIGDGILGGRGLIRRRVPYVIGLLTIGNLVIALSLVRSIGILAVVLGTTIPHLIDYPIHMWQILGAARVSAKSFLKDVALRVYPLLLVPALVAWAGTQTFLAERLIGVVAIAACSVGSYWLAFAVVGLKPAEREEVMSVVRRFRRPS